MSTGVLVGLIQVMGKESRCCEVNDARNNVYVKKVHHFKICQIL